MKTLVALFMVLMLAVGAGFSAVSHAVMIHDRAKDQKTEAVTHGDCHTNAHTKTKPEQVDTRVQKDKAPNKACHKGLCKCMGSTCHSMANVFGEGGYALFLVSKSRLVFGFYDDFAHSALPDRLKRPPKA